MKANVSSAKAVGAAALDNNDFSQYLAAYLELTKPRVTLMVVLTAAAGFYLAPARGVDLLLLFHTLLGTALLSAGTAVLNQFMERKADARMHRTSRRPLPAGMLSPSDALIFGMGLVTSGTLYLILTTNGLTAGLGWLTSAVYLLIYTPLKTKSSICTLIGAFPGATPPLMGWAAASGTLNLDALILFAMLFTWQFPHFLAIAWIYREDYERGGFVMLPPRDLSGLWTSWKMLLFSVLLLAFSVLPSVSGFAGDVYLFGAVLLGAFFIWYSLRVVLLRSKYSARRLLRASVIYLPLILILMTIDKF